MMTKASIQSQIVDSKNHVVGITQNNYTMKGENKNKSKMKQQVTKNGVSKNYKDSDTAN